MGGEHWFVAADVTAALNINRADNILRHLSPDEKRVTPQEVRALTRTHHRSSIISESGLYKLIMRSDKPEARAFQDWVTKVVLPSIRKDGGYVMGEEKVATRVRGACGRGQLCFRRALGMSQKCGPKRVRVICGVQRCPENKFHLYRQIVADMALAGFRLCNMNLIRKQNGLYS